MPKFKVTIEEHYTKEIIVEAESLEEAEEEVETNYICGDIVAWASLPKDPV